MVCIRYPRVKNIILRNFKLLQTYSETASIFKESLLVSFKRDKIYVIPY